MEMMETMMSDFDTMRIGQIAALEEKVMILQKHLADAQKNADKWTPVLTTEADPKDQALKVCLKLSGKMVTVKVTYQAILESDMTALTSAILESMFKNLIADVLRPEIELVLSGVKRNTTALADAGKW